MMKSLAVLLIGGMFASGSALAGPMVHVGVGVGPRVGPPVMVHTVAPYQYRQMWVDGYWTRDARGRRIFVEGYWERVRVPVRAVPPPRHVSPRHVQHRVHRASHPRGRR